MAKFLVKASYTAEGVRVFRALAAGAGRRRGQDGGRSRGRLESFYFAFGDTDAYVILDLPDNRSAAAASIAVNASGAAASEVIVLLTPEDIDAAAKLLVDDRRVLTPRQPALRAAEGTRLSGAAGPARASLNRWLRSRMPRGRRLYF